MQQFWQAFRSSDQVQEFLDGYKTCTQEVIEFLRSNCSGVGNAVALNHLMATILRQALEFERKCKQSAAARPVRNWEILDKIRKKILDKRRQQHKSKRKFPYCNSEKSDFVWRPF